MVTVGYGDIGAQTTGEMLLAIVAMFAGVIFFSLTVGSLTSLLSDLDRKNSLLEERMKILNKIVSRFEISDPKLLQKISMIIKNRIYSSQDRYDELLDCLPKKYALRLSSIIYKDFVGPVKLINSDPELLLSVAPNLLLQRYSRGENIVSQGEYPNEVFFIKKGLVGFVIPQYNNEIFITVSEGNYFGESEIINGVSRNFTIIALESTDILILERKHFVKTFFKEFKDVGNKIKDYSAKRLAKHIKTYDLFISILAEHQDRQTKLLSQNRVNERIEKELIPILYQDSFIESDLKFSPSFFDRNKGLLPPNLKKKNEDILLENVPSIN